MSAHIGLYFPYFHFPSDEWIKVSALYWDKMYRIVPRGYTTKRDSTIVKLLSGKKVSQKALQDEKIDLTKIHVETPFIGHIRPEDFHDDLATIKTAFLNLIKDKSEKLVEHYGIEHRDEWPIDPYTSKYAPKNANPRLAYIYTDKIDVELSKTLFDKKLGTWRSDRPPLYKDYKWIGMHPRLANVYTAALAETLARHEPFRANPITNDPINYFAIGGFTFERLAQVLLDETDFMPKKISEKELESRLAIMAIKGVMPKNIKNIPIDKILNLREAHSGEFGQFQDLVDSVIKELPNVTAAEAGPFVNDYLEAEYKKKIKPKLEKLEDTMSSLGIETIQTVFNLEIKIPPLLAGVGAAGGLAVINPVLGVTAAVAFALLKVFSDGRNNIEKAVDNSDIAFLLHVREDLAPPISLEWLESRVRKVMFGV